MSVDLAAGLRDLARLMGVSVPSVPEVVERRVQIGTDALHARLDALIERLEERIQIEGDAARAHADQTGAALRGEVKGFVAQRQGFVPGFNPTAGLETALAFQIAGLRNALDEQAREITALKAEIAALKAGESR